MSGLLQGSTVGLDGQTSQQVQFLHLVIKYKHKADDAKQAANQPKWLQLQFYCKNMSR